MIFMEAYGTPESDDVTMLCAGCHDHAALWWRCAVVVMCRHHGGYNQNDMPQVEAFK